VRVTVLSRPWERMGPMDVDLEVRPPKQQRSREAWNRVLDAGVAILEDGGYDAFTIAAVCERAAVAPTAIYARTTSKDALFLAVYEHGIAGMVAEQQVFVDDDRWAGLSPAELIRSAVAEMVGISLRRQRFLGSIVLISAAHKEVARRGSRYARELGDGFTRVVLGAPDAIRHADPDAAARACFGTVFAATIIRVAYGPAFATPSPVDDATFVADLGETAVRYLLSAPPR
jgi:AcrR family transcriptional regulator